MTKRRWAFHVSAVAALVVPVGLGAFLHAQEAVPTPQEAISCLSCHASIQSVLGRRFKHAAVDMGCESCHEDHRQSGFAKRDGSAKYLNAKQPDLCQTCHDPAEPKVRDAHKTQLFEKSNCTSCHDPHASDAPKLLPPVSHAPFEAGMCENCHRSPENGKVRLSAASISEMCFGCHEDVKKRVESAASKHTLVAADAGSCVGCHDPHAAARPRLLRGSVNELCSGCHSGVLEGKKFIHAPAAAACTACHDAHASEFASNLHAPPNRLCLECHGENAVRLMQQAEKMTLFDGRTSLPAGVFSQLKFLRLSKDGSRGHPTSNHPVVASESGKSEMNCTTCHTPHASETSPLFYATGTLGSTALCVKCHK